MSVTQISLRVQRGFTLVELLIVVIILAILAAIVVPQFGSSTDDAKLSALDSSLANMRNALALYKQQHGNYPGSTAAAAAAGSDCASGATALTADAVGAITNASSTFKQLTMYSDANGVVCNIGSDKFKYGPYLKITDWPIDPIKNINTTALANTGDLAMTADGTAGGWKYDSKSGKFINNNTSFITGSTTLKYSDR